MNPDNVDLQYAGLMRRMMAVVYDLFLLAAILFIATYLANALNQGKPITPDHPFHSIFVLYLLVISFFYYAWFWTHGGQTLGMKTWRIRLQSKNRVEFDWQRSAVRFVVAQLSWLCVGIGFAWSMFDRQKRTWHDIASGSVLLDVRQSANAPE